MLAASESFAESKRPTRETMLRRCEQRALWCEQSCDEQQLAGDLTDKQYKKCNDKCEDKLKACRRRVDEVRPERTTGGGGDSGSDEGPVLDPDAGDPPGGNGPTQPFSRPGILLNPNP
jgi:hypothetical protein